MAIQTAPAPTSAIKSAIMRRILNQGSMNQWRGAGISPTGVSGGMETMPQIRPGGTPGRMISTGPLPSGGGGTNLGSPKGGARFGYGPVGGGTPYNLGRPPSRIRGPARIGGRPSAGYSGWV